MAKSPSYQFSELNFFHFYRIDELVCGTVRRLLSQLLETYLEQGTCTVLLDLDDEDAFDLARAYRDILIGYQHPRKSSLSRRLDEGNKTLQKLYKRFPSLMSVETIHCHPSREKKT